MPEKRLDLALQENERLRSRIAELNGEAEQLAQKNASLAASNERFQHALASITEGYYSLDDQWRFVEMNPAAERHFGRPADELLGKNIWQVTGTKPSSHLYRTFHLVAAGDQPLRFESHSEIQQGYWAELNLHPHNGGLDVYFRDISDRKRDEAALRESEAVLRNFFDSPGLMRGIVEIVNGVIIHVSCNEFGAKLYGLDRAQVPGKSAVEAGAPPEVARRWVGLYDESRRAGQPVSMEYARRDAEGRDRWLLATASYLGTGPSGNPRFAYAILDLTDRKQAEDALHKHRQWLQVTLDSIGDAVLATDAAGNITFLNPVAAQLTGWTSEQAVGRPARDVFQIINEQTHLKAEDIIERVLRERRVLPLANHTALLSRDGREIPVEDSAAPIQDSAGNVLGVVLVFHDVTGPRRAQEALQERDERLTFVMDAAKLGAWDLDLVNHTAWRSPQHDLVFGYPQLLPEWTYEIFLDHVLPEDREDVDRSFQRAIAEGSDWEFECRIRSAGGAIRWIWAQGRCASGTEGQPLRMTGILKDITARKEAEQAVRDSEDQFRTLANAIPQLCWMANADGWLFWYNQRWYEYTGTTPGQMEGWGWQSVHDPVALPKVMERWQASIATGEPFDMIFPLRGADGVFRPFLTRVMPVHGRDGKVARWFGTNTDVSEQRKAEDALRLSEERLRAAIEASHTGTWHWDIRTGEVELYDTCGRLFGLPGGRKILSTEEYLRFLHPDDRAAVAAGIERSAAEGVDFEREFRVVWPDGSIHWLVDRGTTYFDEDGKPAYITGACVEVTERKRAEEGLRQAQKLESLGMLAGGVAHDFNNLLVGVIGNASLAQELLPPDNPASDLLDGVIKSGEQAAHLTRQMLAYSGRGKFVVEPLDLSTIIPEMCGLVRPSIPKKIALSLDLADDLPPFEADRGQVQQVFMNLTLNAAEAIGSHDGLITVGTGVQDVDELYRVLHPEAANLTHGPYVFLEVRDTGCGMEEAIRARVFDPFFSTKFVGRGLGLAAVAGIVRGHNGAIMVSTEVGKGTCFTVLFPAVQRAAGRPALAARNIALEGSGTLLVVDDEPMVREMVKRALERHGYTVLTADSGLEAIDILRRHAGDITLVILDLSMPGMGGEETLPELRRIRPGVKVVVSTGYSEGETMTLFRGQRVSGFIQKPYTATGIAEKVKLILG